MSLAIYPGSFDPITKGHIRTWINVNFVLTSLSFTWGV